MNKKKFNRKILTGLFFSLALLLSCFPLCRIDIDNNFKSDEHIIDLSSPQTVFELKFNRGFDELIQLKFDAAYNDPVFVQLGGAKLELRSANNSRSGIRSLYYHVPAGMILQDEIPLKINFLKQYPKQLTVKSRNFVTQGVEGDLILSTTGSLNVYKGFFRQIFDFIFLFLVFYLFWNLGIYFNKKICNADQTILIFVNSFSFLFCLSGLGILTAVSLKGPYSLVFSTTMLVVLVFLTVILVNFFSMLLFFFLSFYLSDFKIKSHAPGLDKADSSWVISALRFASQADFFRKCLLVFTIGYILSAFALILDQKLWAERLMNAAYFILLFGIVGKIFNWGIKKAINVIKKNFKNN